MRGAALTLLANLIGVFSIHRDCTKLYNPENYMDQLPSLSLPYVNKLAIPNIPMLKPSPVVTRVVNVVTKYVTKNPVCLKFTGKKPPCKTKKTLKNPLEYIVTKEYFVKDRQLDLQREHKSGDLQGSETQRSYSISSPTPHLDSIRDLLIEDRLDRLEDILPHYKRLRVYKTSTITVTKTRNDGKATATLLVKNCVPEGIDFCRTKAKRREAKVADEFQRNMAVGGSE